MNICFLLYDSRSGSTFLSNLLHKYNKICVTPESAYVSRILDSDIFDDDITVIKIINFLYKEIHFQELPIKKNELIDQLNSLNRLDKKSVIDLINGLLSESIGKGEQILLIKHPAINHLELINLFYNSVKFIHIVRDPRGVHNSKKSSINLKGKYFSRNPLKTGLKWRFKINRINEFEKLNRNCMTIRYEDLLYRQEEILGDIIQFLDIIDVSYDEDFSYSKRIGDRQKHLHKNVDISGITNKAYSWRSSLTKREIDILSFICNKEIAYFNYENIKVRLVSILFPICWFGFKYFITSIKNFFLYYFTNPEMVKSKKIYFKSLLYKK